MEEFMELKWSQMNSLQSTKATAIDDPAKPLKKHVAEQMVECINATHLLAKNISKSSNPEEVAKWSKELNERSATIKGTGKMLEQMPLALAGLDAHLDAALTCAALLPDVAHTLARKIGPGESTGTR